MKHEKVLEMKHEKVLEMKHEKVLEMKHEKVLEMKNHSQVPHGNIELRAIEHSHRRRTTLVRVRLQSILCM